MTNFTQFFNDSRKALTYSNEERYVNTDKFNAWDKFNDIYNSAISTIREQYSLPAFHIWETGYCQGEATNEEISELINKINLEQGTERLSFDTDLFNFLDDELIDTMQEEVDDLIHDFNKFINNELGVTIILDYGEVRMLLIDEMKIANDFSWSGWRIPIYLDGADNAEAGDIIKCGLSSGGWLSQGSHQPDGIEIYWIESWSLDYDLTDDMDKDEEILFSIEEILNNYNWEERIEENIFEYFNDISHTEYSEYNVTVEWKY